MAEYLSDVGGGFFLDDAYDAVDDGEDWAFVTSSGGRSVKP